MPIPVSRCRTRSKGWAAGTFVGEVSPAITKIIVWITLTFGTHGYVLEKNIIFQPIPAFRQGQLIRQIL